MKTLLYTLLLLFLFSCSEQIPTEKPIPVVSTNMPTAVIPSSDYRKNCTGTFTCSDGKPAGFTFNPDSTYSFSYSQCTFGSWDKGTYQHKGNMLVLKSNYLKDGEEKDNHLNWYKNACLTGTGLIITDKGLLWTRDGSVSDLYIRNVPEQKTPSGFFKTETE